MNNPTMEGAVVHDEDEMRVCHCINIEEIPEFLVVSVMICFICSL